MSFSKVAQRNAYKTTKPHPEEAVTCRSGLDDVEHAEPKLTLSARVFVAATYARISDSPSPQITSLRASTTSRRQLADEFLQCPNAAASPESPLRTPRPTAAPSLPGEDPPTDRARPDAGHRQPQAERQKRDAERRQEHRRRHARGQRRLLVMRPDRGYERDRHQEVAGGDQRVLPAHSPATAAPARLIATASATLMPSTAADRMPPA